MNLLDRKELVLLFAVLVALGLGYATGWQDCAEHQKNLAVKAGHAEWVATGQNQTEFKWKEIKQ